MEGEKREVVVEGCWDRSIFKALSFHLFSFNISLLFRRKKKARRNKEKGKPNTRSHTHTEKRPRWPSLIKGIFQERLTSLSTMLRQDIPTANPHPNKPQLPKGDLYLCHGGKAQHSHPNVTLCPHQTGLTCSCRMVHFM